jgi:hypothetical protein
MHPPRAQPDEQPQSNQMTRTVSAPTILDVIDNFFGADAEILHEPGHRLMEFGEEVRRFSAAWDARSVEREVYPVYVGGLPSANIWLAQHGQLVLTTLLYSDRAIARDPVSDWFADERYESPTLSRSRPGYRGGDGASPAVAETRQFLVNAIAGLRILRPLIEAGIVVPIPPRRILAEHPDEVRNVATAVSDRALADVAGVALRFRPRELAVEDNVRGLFVLAGGERQQQVRKAFGDAIQFFAGEIVLSGALGANYLAPFSFETYLVQEGLDRDVFGDPSARVARGVLDSQLPVFEGLFPGVVAAIHDDDAFGAFRRDLHQAYAGLPLGDSEEAARYLTSVEEAVLRPLIVEAERQVSRGRLRNMARVGQDSVRFAATLAGSTAAAAAGLRPEVGALTAVGTWGVIQRLRGGRQAPASQPVWTVLTGHRHSAGSEVAGLN